jgi:hypothetical protein
VADLEVLNEVVAALAGGWVASQTLEFPGYEVAESGANELVLCDNAVLNNRLCDLRFLLAREYAVVQLMDSGIPLR